MQRSPGIGPRGARAGAHEGDLSAPAAGIGGWATDRRWAYEDARRNAAARGASDPPISAAGRFAPFTSNE